MNVDEVFLRRAIELATMSVSRGGGPFGAVLVREGRVVAEGMNRVTQTLDPTAHAEVVTIREGCQALGDFRLSDCTLYASTEPCPMCLAALHWARVQRIVFAATQQDAAQAGFDDAYLYEQLALPFAQRSLPLEHFAHPEATRPFEAWSAHVEKVAY